MPTTLHSTNNLQITLIHYNTIPHFRFHLCIIFFSLQCFYFSSHTYYFKYSFKVISYTFRILSNNIHSINFQYIAIFFLLSFRTHLILNAYILGFKIWQFLHRFLSGIFYLNNIFFNFWSIFNLYSNYNAIFSL